MKLDFEKLIEKQNDILKVIENMFFGVKEPDLIVIHFREGREPKTRRSTAWEFAERLIYRIPELKKAVSKRIENIIRSQDLSLKNE